MACLANKAADPVIRNVFLSLHALSGASGEVQSEVEGEALFLFSKVFILFPLGVFRIGGDEL